MRKRKQQYLVHYSYYHDSNKNTEEWQLAKNVPKSLIDDYKMRSDSPYGIMNHIVLLGLKALIQIQTLPCYRR